MNSAAVLSNDDVHAAATTCQKLGHGAMKPKQSPAAAAPCAAPAPPPPPQNRSKPDYQPQYGVIVLCQDEADHQRVFRHLKALGYRVKVVCT